MATEIERKFLVTSDLWREGAEGTPMRQGYLCRQSGKTVRVRISGQRALLTVKGPSHGLSRPEFEYEIPLPDGFELLGLCEGPLIEKIRYRVLVEGLVWEIDEFSGDNEGLIVAEVELASEDQSVPLPPWIGSEVSEDSRYTNSSLSLHPFKEWRDSV